MTAKTSLFNRGIYTSTIRRYRLGSVLYFIILALTTVFPILFSVDPNRQYLGRDISLILQDAYYAFPLICSYVVPTVVALLVYRFLHSKKTAIFVHSLPVSRTANYLSTLAAAFTLMAIPVILDALLLMVLAVCGYGALFTVVDCMIWMGVNLLSLFLMFSVATFASALTGNSFAMVGINVMLHFIGLILAGGISAFSRLFLYGYYETSRLLRLAEGWNFGYYIGQFHNYFNAEFSIPFAWSTLLIMLALAVVLYVLAWVLYRRRRMEVAEDVAGYRVLNPIFKYALTLIAASAAFLLAAETLMNGLWLTVILVLVVSAVTYFATEMLLKKNLKIWKSYKGYLVFLAAFSAFICVFAFTEMFGFESRIPDIQEIESVSLTENGWYEVGRHVNHEEVKEIALAFHRDMLQDEMRYTLSSQANQPNSMFVVYRLKNGKTMTRRYEVSEAKKCEVMDALYAFREYKMQNIELFYEAIGEFHSIDFGAVSIRDVDEINGLIEALTADLLEIDYTETVGSDLWQTSMHIEYKPENGVEEEYRVYNVHQRINANYRNTIAWLISNGYANELFNREGHDLTVLTGEQWKTYLQNQEEVGYVNSKLSYVATQVTVEEARTLADIPGAVRITSPEEKAEIRNLVINTPVRYLPDKEYAYFVCYLSEGDYVHPIAAFYDDASGISQYSK